MKFPNMCSTFKVGHLFETGVCLMAGMLIGLSEARAQAPFPLDLHAWFKADAGVTVDSDVVTEWVDQSANSHVLTPPSGGPVLTTDALNGLPALSFNGSTQLNGNFGSTPLTAATVFAVFRYTVPDSDNDYLYSLGTNGGSGSQITLSRRSSSRIYHYDGSNQLIGAAGTLPADTWFVSSQVIGTGDGTRHSIFLNGASVQRTTASNPYSANLSTAVIGNWSSGGNRFVGDLVELLVYNRALEEAERSVVEDYLRERAGLPEFFKGDAEILSGWEVVQYEFGAQTDAVWTFDLGGTRADQANNSDASILLSEIDVADKVIWGQFGSGSAPDFMGFVFGFQSTREFYLFDWKKVTASYQSFGVAEAGMRLTAFHVDGEEPTGRDFWASDREEHTTALRRNDIPWAGGVDYDFSLSFAPGAFTIRVWQGETVLETWTVQDSTYTSGRFGYFSNSLQGVRYGQVFVNEAGPIRIDSMNLTSDQIALRWLGGEPPYVIESSETLQNFEGVSGHIWNRTGTVPAVMNQEFFRIRSIGAELSASP